MQSHSAEDPVRRMRWFIALSPDGAARSAGESIIAAFRAIAEKDAVKTFDTLAYRTAFRKLLATPDDTMAADLLNQSLIVQCLDFRATHLLVLALCPITLFSLDLLRRQGVITMHWFYEDYRRATYWRDVIAGYDLFCAVQRGAVEAWCKAHPSTRYELLPTAASLPPTAARPDEKTVDVAFAGLPSEYRISVLERLASGGISLAVAGSGWESYRGPLQQCIRGVKWTDQTALLRSARIGINLSKDDPADDRADAQISPRAYDILAAGAVLLTENVPLARELLRGYSFHAFTDREDALMKARAIIADWEAEKTTAESNRARAASRDTYGRRVRKIIELAGEYRARDAGRRRSCA
jgi:hypothetical protein